MSGSLVCREMSDSRMQHNSNSESVQNVARRKGPQIRDRFRVQPNIKQAFSFCCGNLLFFSLCFPPFFLSFARQRMALSRISLSVTLPNMKTLMSGVFLSQRVNLNPTQNEQSPHSTLSTTLTKTLINQQVPLTIQHTLSLTQILA